MISISKERRNIVVRVGLDTAKPTLESTLDAFNAAAAAGQPQLTKLVFSTLLLALAQALIDEASKVEVRRDDQDTETDEPRQVH